MALTANLSTYPTSSADAKSMAVLAYTATETVLYDYGNTEDYYILAEPPAIAVNTLYRVGIEYAYKWYGLNSGNTLTVINFPFNLNYVSQAPFRAPPVITSVSPDSGTTGDSIVITGSGFTQASSVTFDGNSATFTIITGSKIIAVVP